MYYFWKEKWVKKARRKWKQSFYFRNTKHQRQSTLKKRSPLFSPTPLRWLKYLFWYQCDLSNSFGAYKIWKHILKIVHLERNINYQCLSFLILLWGSVQFLYQWQPYGLLWLTSRTTAPMECWNITNSLLSSKNHIDSPLSRDWFSWVISFCR